ncbi:MAG: arginine repressor [Clostridiales bacterium]|nr:arginine repressor [Clostridiales bacterium]
MKLKRQSKIIELINKNDIETQEELARLLQDADFSVTQATISRDIRELKITKVMDGKKQKYALLPDETPVVSEKLIRIFRDAVTHIDCSQNIIVIKTLDGMAMAVAAVLDSMENSEILGSIAGDDTVFCVIKSEKNAVKLIERLKEPIGIKDVPND